MVLSREPVAVVADHADGQNEATERIGIGPVNASRPTKASHIACRTRKPAARG